MSDETKVSVGDIYRDKDPRMSNRYVKVKSFDSRYAYVIACDAEGHEIGRRTRVSLTGLESRFERAGGSTVKADLERAVIDAAVKWRKAEIELTAATPTTRDSSDTPVFMQVAIVRRDVALAALRKSVDALRPEPAAGTEES